MYAEGSTIDVIRLVICFGVVAPPIALVIYLVKLNRWNDPTKPKPKFPWWTVIYWVVICLLPVLIYLALFLITSFVPSIPFSPNSPSTVRVSTPTPRVTPTPSCKIAALVTGSYEGQRICVYGNITRQEFHVYNNTTRLFFTDQKGFFIVCEHCYYPDLEPGDCVSVTGTVGLSTDKYPYIVARGLDSCP